MSKSFSESKPNQNITQQNTAMKKLIIFAAGGSAGHILPARFVAEELLDKHNCQVEFIGTGKPLEQSLIQDFGIPLHQFPMAGIHRRGLKGYLEFILLAAKNFFKVYSLIRKKKPVVVVGFGAYISVLPVVCARLQGIPTLIHDAERKIGLANKLLAYFAKTATCAYADTKFPSKPKVVYTGQPVQPKIQEYIQHNGARADFPSLPQKILILGGSQGALSIDNAMIELSSFLKQNNFEIWHQCRRDAVAEIKKTYKKYEVNARVEPFIKDPLEAYLWADLLIGRSGAGITREVGLLGIPSIFIPLPGSSSNNHQYQNAEALEQLGKAIVVQEGGLLAEQIKLQLAKLLEADHYKNLCKLLVAEKTESASAKIAQEVIALA